MAGTYRDDHEAALRRAEELERENARLRAMLNERDPDALNPGVKVFPPNENRFRAKAALAWGVVVAVFTAVYYGVGGS